MLSWGQTVFKPYLEGLGYLFYWSICFLFTLLAILTALLDVRMLRRQTKNQHREVFKRTLSDFDLETPPKDHHRKDRPQT